MVNDPACLPPLPHLTLKELTNQLVQEAWVAGPPMSREQLQEGQAAALVSRAEKAGQKEWDHPADGVCACARCPCTRKAFWGECQQAASTREAIKTAAAWVQQKEPCKGGKPIPGSYLCRSCSNKRCTGSRATASAP